MTKYVLGFAFDARIPAGPTDPTLAVALIEKRRPDWQAGHLNGIGGHIESTDDGAHYAMVREFREETGLWVPAWEHYATMENPDWSVECFRAFNVPIENVQAMTDEEVFVHFVDELPANVLSNLRWLIPLALDSEPTTPTIIKYGVWADRANGGNS